MPRRKVRTSDPTNEETPKMTENTGFDFASLADLVEESPEQIARVSTRNKYANNPFAPHVAKSRETGKPMQLPVPGHAVKEVVNHLRAAAKENGHGLRLNVPVNHPTDATPVLVRFQAKEGRVSAGKTDCPICGESVSVTSDGKVRVHGPRNARCEGSGREAE